MPRLSRARVEENQEAIEGAALRVFTRLGYHGTTVREIAEAAGVSMGNLYNYYAGKEELFAAVVHRYETRMEALRRRALATVENCFDPDQLARMAEVIRDIVYKNPDYWRLMYIDVIEFGSKHFAPEFRSLARNIEKRLGNKLKASTQRVSWTGIDPALAFTSIYLQFVTYFLVEKLFGGKQHLGMSDDRAVAQLIKLMTEGLWHNRNTQFGAKESDRHEAKTQYTSA